jgi:hypothetical protein
MLVIIRRAWGSGAVPDSRRLRNARGECQKRHADRQAGDRSRGLRPWSTQSTPHPDFLFAALCR